MYKVKLAHNYEPVELCKKKKKDVHTNKCALTLANNLFLKIVSVLRNQFKESILKGL